MGGPPFPSPRHLQASFLKKEMIVMIVMIVKKGVFPYKVAKRRQGVHGMLMNMGDRGRGGAGSLIFYNLTGEMSSFHYMEMSG